MKTIEKRAEKYLESERLTIARMVEAYDLPKEARQTISHHRYHDYVQGATDQRRIDVKKACKILNEFTDGRLGATFMKQFRKALEDEE